MLAVKEVFSQQNENLGTEPSKELFKQIPRAAPNHVII